MIKTETNISLIKRKKVCAVDFDRLVRLTPLDANGKTRNCTILLLLLLAPHANNFDTVPTYKSKHDRKADVDHSACLNLI